LKESNSFIQKVYIKLIKTDSKDFHIVMMFFQLYADYYSKQNVSLFPQKNIKQNNCFKYL